LQPPISDKAPSYARTPYTLQPGNRTTVVKHKHATVLLEQ
jgi:hypothetical protein